MKTTFLFQMGSHNTRLLRLRLQGAVELITKTLVVFGEFARLQHVKRVPKVESKNMFTRNHDEVV